MDIEFTPEEIAIGEAFAKSVEDGSLRAKSDAKIDPEWNAKYGDASWEAALTVFGWPLPSSPLTPVHVVGRRSGKPSRRPG